MAKERVKVIYVGTAYAGQTRYLSPDTGNLYQFAEGGCLYNCGFQPAPTSKDGPAAWSNGHHRVEEYREVTQVADSHYEAKRDTGKPRFDLLETGCPDALLGVVAVMTWAVEVKGYRPHSWKEVPEATRRYKAAMSRHRNALERGELVDDESGLPHEDHIACNAIFLAQLLRIKPE